MTKPFLIDTHAHLHFSPYHHDLADVLARMRERRVWAITIGTALANSEQGIALAEAQPDVWAAVGLHPEHCSSSFHDADEGEVQEKTVDPERLHRLARSSPKVVALGETGLDFFRVDQNLDADEARQLQETSFRAHLLVAHELNLPVVIHCREALTRLAEILQDEIQAGRVQRGVVHSFTGTWDEAKPLLDLGFYIGVNGIATFPLRKTQAASTAIDRTIENIPLERLLLETDAPYLAPIPFRGQRNEPVWVEEVAKHVARVRGITLEEVARVTTENAIGLFNLTT